MYNVDANVSGHGEVCFPSCMVVYFYTFSIKHCKILISMNIVHCTAAKTAIVLTLSSELPTDPAWVSTFRQPSHTDDHHHHCHHHCHHHHHHHPCHKHQNAHTDAITSYVVCSSKNGSSKRFHTLFSRMPLGGSRWI